MVEVKMYTMLGMVTTIFSLGLPIVKAFGLVSCSWLLAFLPLIIIISVAVGAASGELDD